MKTTILLGLILIGSLVLLFQTNNIEYFGTVEQDLEHYNRFTNYTLNSDQFVHHDTVPPYEPVCD